MLTKAEPDQAEVNDQPARLFLIGAVLVFCAALAAYLTDVAAHRGGLLAWFDLNVYNDAGLITRQLPSYLYIWELSRTIKFTYTPFAAVVFAGGSFLPWAVLRWVMTIASLVSVPVTAWLTLGALGRRGASRAAAALAVGAVALWTEPVVKSLFLGQIEPLLLLLVVWDLTRDDRRRWKGVGIGIAAGIKLVPLLFIPYLLLAGRFRQAAVATATFAATFAIGFVVLPGPSASYWLTGYFIRPGRTGGVDSLVNQSLLGMIARQVGGGVYAEPFWLPVAVVVALGGVAAGAALNRAGKAVPGWVLVGITSVLVSPISWDHHWVWIVPMLAMLAGLAMTAFGRDRWAYLTAALVTAVVFGSWTAKYSGPDAFVPSRGLIGWFVQPRGTEATNLHGWQLLSWNLFVVGGLVSYAVLVAGAWRAWRSQRGRPTAAPGLSSPVEALLARADAVLKSSGALLARDRTRLP
ncbi:MAG TPA: glycosyltransferase 87 family protein [Streptosporangiaceae bacterium]|nr:glycosyltransferase 87 family protein [Streptosporangiaceae bacterium]